MRNRNPISSSKHASILLFALITIVAVAAIPPASHAQFIPCNIVSLKVSSPDSVQSGQLLQVTTTLQISCDPSTYPIIRLDLLDGRTSRVLSSASVPYPPSTSFTVTGINQATAPSVTQTWPLEVQAYVINGINGQVAASSSQSFSVNVVPYTPPITTTTQQSATISLSVVTSTMPTLSSQTTSQTTMTESSQMTLTSQTSSTVSTSSTGFDFTQLLLPAAVVVAVALAIIGVLIVRGRKLDSKTPAARVGFCGQCGTELLRNAKFCGKCGAKQS